MKRNLFASMACAAMAGTLLLTGCMESVSSSVYNPNASKEEFEANWEATFGEVDPQQNWNAATRATATVSVAYTGDYTAKIYTSDPRDTEPQAYLLGKMDVKGNQSASLSLNIPASQTEVYVALVDKDMKRIVKTAAVNDGRINVQFGGAETRAVTTDTSDNYVTAASQKQFPYAAYDKFLSLIPEGDNTNADKDDVYADFYYKSNGTFSLYAIYKVTSITPTIGIEYKTPDSDSWVDADLFNVGSIKFATVYGWGVQEGEQYSSETAYQNGFDYSICEGVTINFPNDTEFRFYMKANSTTWYSVKEMNSDGKSHFATFNNGYKIDDKEVLFVGGEDWTQDYDLNDVVCAFVGDVALPKIVDVNDPDPTPTEEEKDTDPDDDVSYMWIICCEDLGATDDFDFNDIVFGINYVSGETTAQVIPLAAGGTLPAHIYNNSTTPSEIGEIHTLLGYEGETGKMINTTGRGTAGDPVSISVPYDWNLEQNMGGFYIDVTNNNKTTTSVTAPGRGTAPQMILIAGANNWAWPKERHNISKAYPQFGEWGCDYTTNTDWYLYPTAGEVVQ